MTAAYRNDVERLIHQTASGEAEWEHREQGLFVLTSFGGDIYLSPTIVGITLAVQQHHDRLPLPTMYGDSIHSEDFALLIRLYRAVIERQEFGLAAVGSLALSIRAIVVMGAGGG